MYKLLYHPAVAKFFKKLSKDEARKIIEKMNTVATNPYAPNTNIKRMADSVKSYRLRVGNIRVIYELNSTTQTIYIMDADFRGNIY